MLEDVYPESYWLGPWKWALDGNQAIATIPYNYILSKHLIPSVVVSNCGLSKVIKKKKIDSIVELSDADDTNIPVCFPPSFM